jgi:hypothetical protein
MRYKIFVSGVQKELEDERRAVKELTRENDQRKHTIE